MSNEFVALQCPSCGGKLNVKRETIDSLFIQQDSTFIFIGAGTGDEQIECEHCHTKFERRQRLQQASSFANAFNQAGQKVSGTQINVVTNGGAFIGGNIHVGGDFVGRSRRVNSKDE